MQALFEVILPVFLVMGAGYLATRLGLFEDRAVDALMRFAQNFAVPCVLFKGVAQLDLSSAYDAGLMISFYAGAFTSFTLGALGARALFGRPGPDAVAIGFAGLFSNSLLLGLPITERAYGTAALSGNYAIISIHAPMLYAFGITMMELTRAHGIGLPVGQIARQIFRGIVTNPLVIGIALGFAVNVSGDPLPEPVWAGVDMLARAGLPAALFGLGGVMVRYRPEGDLRLVAMIASCSLLLHPGLAWFLGTRVYGLDTAALRSVVVTASMAPGINAYLFANMYGVAKRVAATAVLLSTALSILTVWFWLHVLP
ncbi:AEC family transporter [Frigidibacter sp. SD6-1]|uniref:AEC family transporter n=1 Tax=Frigidibacter sp. SD6-1 TaxID=3032581 RepID=UPI0024DFD5B9|nr:AEC family transporter [Frigidibacter sp. SD6-1]